MKFKSKLAALKRLKELEENNEKLKLGKIVSKINAKQDEMQEIQNGIGAKKRWAINLIRARYVPRMSQ